MNKKHDFSKKRLAMVNKKRYKVFYNRYKKLIVLKTKKGKTKVYPIPLWQNPFPDDIIVNYHHINGVFVVPIPEETHKFIPGTRSEHREMTNKLIEEIYNIDLNKIIHG
jgi:hypothetical protein